MNTDIVSPSSRYHPWLVVALLVPVAGVCLPPRTRLSEEQQRLLRASLAEDGFCALVGQS